MTAHRVRIFHSTAGSDSYHTWSDQWLLNMSPWSYPEVDNDLPTQTTTIDGDLTYYHGELAFDWSEDKAIIFDQLDQYAASYCDWHRIGYHACTHDEDNPQPCSWDETRENGTIPDDTPTFN